MSFTLDGQKVFGESDESGLDIEPGSISRDSIDKTVSGLDGVLSIDLGRRSRKIKQKGVLRAGSRKQMREKVNAMSAYIDGCTHKLVADSGEEFDNLRMDVFEVSKERASGGGLCCDYEIVYTQLRV
jgi:hypothetical protein